jgi:phage virion morphogenesis protein
MTSSGGHEGNQMARSFHGDLAKLDGLIATFRRAADPGMLEKMNRTIAENLVTQVRMGFRLSRDPYGTAWKPLKGARTRNKRGGDRGKPLVDTGRLRGSLSYSDVSPRGFRLGSNVAYAPVHQYGSRKIPARPMLPTRDKGLGPVWARSVRQVMNRRIRELFRR